MSEVKIAQRPGAGIVDTSLPNKTDTPEFYEASSEVIRQALATVMQVIGMTY